MEQFFCTPVMRVQKLVLMFLLVEPCRQQQVELPVGPTCCLSGQTVSHREVTVPSWVLPGHNKTCVSVFTKGRAYFHSCARHLCVLPPPPPPVSTSGSSPPGPRPLCPPSWFQKPSWLQKCCLSSYQSIVFSNGKENYWFPKTLKFLY